MNEIERDPRLDAAWRSTSREEPPPALDATILAAARQAVDAAPRSNRDKHWWYPLAAAATVAVLAVGIAQLTPPERVAPTIESAVAPREAQQNGEQQSVAVDAKGSTPPTVVPATAPLGPANVSATPPRSPTAGAIAGARHRASENKLREQAVQAQREASAQNTLAGAVSETAPAAHAPQPPAVAAAPAVAVRSEPFPAASKKEPPRVASAASVPAESAPAGTVVEQPQLQSRMVAAKVVPADEARLKDASARSVEAWIKRIRDLKNEGRTEEAAKELAAFRAAYGERADALLPTDLQSSKR